MTISTSDKTDDTVIVVSLDGEIEESWVDMVLINKDDLRERETLTLIQRYYHQIGNHLCAAAKSKDGAEALNEGKRAVKKLKAMVDTIRLLDRQRHGDGQKMAVIENGEEMPVGNATLKLSDELIEELFTNQVRNLFEIAESARERARSQKCGAEAHLLPEPQAEWEASFLELAELAQDQYVRIQSLFMDVKKKRCQEIHISRTNKQSKRNGRKAEIFKIAQYVPKGRKIGNGVG